MRPLRDDEAINENGVIVTGLFAGGYHGCRYEMRSVEESGLPNDRGNDRDLKAHVVGNAQSAFRGLSNIPVGDARFFKTPAEFATDRGLVVEVYGVIGWPTDMHCPETIKSLPRGEGETAILRPVPRSSIRAIHRVVERQRVKGSILVLAKVNDDV